MSGAAPAPVVAEVPVELDRAAFERTVPVMALVVPTRKTHMYMKTLFKYLLNFPKTRNVADIPGDSDHKLLILSEEISAALAGRDGVPPASEEVAGETGATGGDGGENGGDGDLGETANAADLGETAPAPPAATSAPARAIVPPPLAAAIERDGLSVRPTSVRQTYEHLTTAEVLRRLLPGSVSVPSSFETVGHLAHLNLREDALPYGRLIARAILDKNPRLRTVLNKTGAIHARWRTFDMEILAGDDQTLAEVSEHGARFRLDFRDVYWNSRLEREHARLPETYVRRGDVVLDACAGVGPFAVPCARRGATIFASDLNPASYRWLRVNVALNGIRGAVRALNLDAREAIRLAAAGRLAGGDVPADAHKREPGPWLAGKGPGRPGKPRPKPAVTTADTVSGGGAAAGGAKDGGAPSVGGGGKGGKRGGERGDGDDGAGAGNVAGGRQKHGAGRGEATDGGSGEHTAADAEGSTASAAAEIPRGGLGGRGQPGTTSSPPQAPTRPEPAGPSPSATPASPSPPMPDVCPVPFQHVILNLPASAVEFLDAFRGAFSRGLWPDPATLPLVHVYTFAPDDTPLATLQELVESHLGGSLDAPCVAHNVRDVSPKKSMFCVTFRVPASVAYGEAGREGGGREANGVGDGGGVEGAADAGGSARDGDDLAVKASSAIGDGDATLSRAGEGRGEAKRARVAPEGGDLEKERGDLREG